MHNIAACQLFLACESSPGTSLWAPPPCSWSNQVTERLHTTSLTASAPAPDFTCIGLHKSGTGWLFEQLRMHPDFWMPPIKEIRYLDREEPPIEEAKSLLERVQSGKKMPPRLGPIDARDVQFLEVFSSLTPGKINLDLYGSMFRFKGALLSGDVTPSYCIVTDETIAQVFNAFPRLKVMLLLRDPVSRAWSHFAMFNRRQTFEAGSLQDAKEFRELLRTRKSARKIILLSRLTQMVQRWQQRVPPGQFRYFFFDDIVANADTTLSEMLGFLGADPKRRGPIAPDFNRKSTRFKLEMSDDIKAILIDALKDELRAGRDMFGGHAIEWAKKYGVT
jgi:hypothetical protein